MALYRIPYYRLECPGCHKCTSLPEASLEEIAQNRLASTTGASYLTLVCLVVRVPINSISFTVETRERRNGKTNFVQCQSLFAFASLPNAVIATAKLV